MDLFPGDCDVFVPLYCDPAYPCTPRVVVTAAGTDGWIGEITNAYACNVGLGGGRVYFHGPTSVETVYDDYVGIDCAESCTFSMNLDVYRPAIMGVGWVHVGTIDSGANLSCLHCTGVQSE